MYTGNSAQARANSLYHKDLRNSGGSAGDCQSLSKTTNTSAGNMVGLQMGGINTSAGNTMGFQFGLVNTTVKNLTGFQLGLINYADSVEAGTGDSAIISSIPIGLISIVRNGGYQAVEYSLSELYPVHVTIKLGVEKFYTSIIGAFNSIGGFDMDYFAAGLGMGSILPINSLFFFNPEVNFINTFTDNRQLYTSLLPFFGCRIGRHLSFTLGPSVTWAHDNDGALQKPFFKIYEYTINANNSIVIGARAGIQLRL
jgi:hypothetical protein